MAVRIVQKFKDSVKKFYKEIASDLNKWLKSHGVDPSQCSLVNAVDENGEPLVITAVGEKDELVLAALLSHGCNANCRSTQGIPAISRALMTMELSTVKLLVENGADVNLMDPQGRSPLFYAIGMQAIEFMVNAGTLVNVRDSDGNYPNFMDENRKLLINEAIVKADVAWFERLLSMGCELNYSDKDNDLPIRRALRFRSTRMVNKLLDLGVEINTCNAEGESVLEVCLEDCSLLKLLISKNADVNFRNGKGQSMLELAYGKVGTDNKCFALLLKHGADPNTIAANGCSLVMRAICSIDFVRLEMLIKAGADVDRLDKMEHLLRQAFLQDYRYSVEALLKAGVDCKWVDSKGMSAIGYAYETRYTKSYDLLIEHGADVNFVFPDSGDSILMKALKDGKDELANLLIKSGADVNVYNKRHSPLKYAVLSGNIKLVKMLWVAGAKTDLYPSMASELCESAALRNDIKMVGWLYEHGVQLPADIKAWYENPLRGKLRFYTNREIYQNLFSAVVKNNVQYIRDYFKDSKRNINEISDNEEPLLYVAMTKCNVEMAKVLLEIGADVNKRTRSGNPLIFLAINSGDMELIDLFIEAGADVNVTDRIKNPLLYSVIQSRNYDVIQKLLDAGANPNAKNPVGRTMLQVAEATMDNRIISMLNLAKDRQGRLADNKPKVSEIVSMSEKPKVSEIVSMSEKPKVSEIVSMSEKPKDSENVEMIETSKVSEIVSMSEKPKGDESDEMTDLGH